MATQYGLLIDYQLCSGCHSCEVACKNEKGLGVGEWGIKINEHGPWKKEDGKFEWDYIPAPTSHCDLCVDRIAAGETASCVLHCLAEVMEVGPVEELAKKMAAKGKKCVLYTP